MPVPAGGGKAALAKKSYMPKPDRKPKRKGSR